MNKTSAKEWLIKSWHNLSTAQLLYAANHYTDVIAVELHYACEKALKAMIVSQNKKIPKTHDLLEIYKSITQMIDMDDYLVLLDQISKYHIEESYPAFNRSLPSKKEIQEVLSFTESIFKEVCKLLEIDINEIKND